MLNFIELRTAKHDGITHSLDEIAREGVPAGWAGWVPGVAEPGAAPSRGQAPLSQSSGGV